MTADERLDLLAKGLRELADKLAAPPVVPPPPPIPPVPVPPVPEPPVPVPDPDKTTLSGRKEIDVLHVHDGKTLELLPGTELIRLDLPAADHEGHPGGGLLVDGHLAAEGATFRSANPGGVRGHVMVTGEGTVRLVNCKLVDMGRTSIAPLSPDNPIGVYLLHFHKVNHAKPSLVEGCEITSTNIWVRHGIVIHGPNQGLVVRGNTVRGTGGSGVYCEDGSEQCLIEGNVVSDVFGWNGDYLTNPARPDSRDIWAGDLGYNGSGIYCRGPLAKVRGNTVRRCPIGYLYFQFGVFSRLESIAEFSGNTAEDCYNGAEFWSIGGNGWEDWQRVRPVRSVVSGFTARRCRIGVFSYEQIDTTYTGLLLEDCEVGVQQNDYLQVRFELRDSTFRNCLFVPSTVVAGDLQVDGCTFDGANSGVAMSTLWFNNDPRQIPARRVVVRNCQLLNGARIHMGETGSGRRNFLQTDELFVEAEDGTRYQVYRDTQAPDAVLPATVFEADGVTPLHVGGPKEGMTNREALEKYGVCRAGALTPPDAVAVPWVVGGRVARVG